MRHRQGGQNTLNREPLNDDSSTLLTRQLSSLVQPFTLFRNYGLWTLWVDCCTTF